MAKVAFSNNFWGFDDSGVTALIGRMSDAKSTNEELRQFFKERVAIEEDYAKRLQKLAKFPVGQHESGSMRASLDSLKQEATSTADGHTAAARQLSEEVEACISTMASTIRERRKQAQSSVEKVFRLKLQQQAEVKRSKERYETDCVKVNGYLAQQNLLLGRDLERNNAKLEKLQSTLHLSQADYDNATRNLQSTVSNWVSEWRDACDKFQDLEEERLASTKNALWTYANIVSQVCVSDDEACERLRVALESCDPQADIQAFVEHKKTGNEILHPPEVTAFQDGYDQPAQVAFSVAKFERGQASASRLPQRMLVELPNGLNHERSRSIRNGVKGGEVRPVINQHPLDGITQLCRSDSNATYASESTGIAASSIYSPIPPNGQHTPTASMSTTERLLGRPASPVRRKSIAERMDSVLSNRSSDKSAAPILKAQRTGSSIFDVLKPSKSRSRNTLRASASMPAEASGTGSIVSQASSHGSYRAPVYSTQQDPIAQALENLKLRSHASTTSRQAPEAAPHGQPQRRHTRVPSLSEPVSPAGSDVGPARGNYRADQRNSLVAPPPAHSAEEMRSVEQSFVRRWSGAPHGTTTAPALQRSPSPGFSHPPGDLRRSPSPQPASNARHAPEKRHTYTQGTFEAERLAYMRSSPDPLQRPSSRAYSQMHDSAVRSVSRSNSRGDKRQSPGDDREASYNMDSRYDHTGGREAAPAAGQIYHPLNRTRSKSFADLAAARPRYTPDGVEILRFATALYDFQATIPEEIGFGQGDTLAIVEMREDGWWLGQVVGLRNARRGLVPSNFFPTSS